MTFDRSQKAYAPSLGTVSTNGPIISNRDPTSYDVTYPLGQFWINTIGQNLFYLGSQSTLTGRLQSTWVSVEATFSTISDTANLPVSPSDPTATPPNNIQLDCNDGTVTITSDPNNHKLLLSANAPGFNWTIVNANQTVVKNNGYFSDGVARLEFTLPALASVGDTFQVADISGQGFELIQGASQYIRVGNNVSTVGPLGYIQSTAIGDWVTFVCCETDNGWLAKIEQGVIKVI